MNWVHLFTSSDGRISRQTFWIAMIVIVAAELGSYLLTMQIGDRLGAIVDIVLIYPEFAVFAKRAHDRDTSPWVVGLLFAISLAFSLATLFGLVDADKLQSNGGLTYAVVIAFGLFALIVFIDLGFRRGTRGPNRFGPDPLEAAA